MMLLAGGTPTRLLARRPATPLAACKTIGCASIVALLVALAVVDPAAAAQVRRGSISTPAVHHDISPPLRSIPPAPPQRHKTFIPLRKGPGTAANGGSTGAVQRSTGSAAAPVLSLNFEGLLNACSCTPPDPNGAVGPNHFVEIVNEQFEIFNKSGGVVKAAVPTNTIWAGFGGGCQTNNDGDGTVAYDRIADRWIVQQFSLGANGHGPYLECVAASTSGDPTGSYARYAFSESDLPDYPKLGVWPDAYYATFNLFHSGTKFSGAQVCAYDRGMMLLGQAATQQCVTLPALTTFGLLPSDLDGSTPPPAGSPNYLLQLGEDSAGNLTGNTLDMFKYHVDWATPANSTLTGPNPISVANYTGACNYGATNCIPQPGGNNLSSLADRLMYRLAYRNFGDHESLVTTHSVTAGAGAGVRWYELRSPSGTPTVFQQGTYAPSDGVFRWMGSAAMDRGGGIALGYSAGSSTVNAGIRYTSRLASDPPGTMQAEGTVQNGGGHETGAQRWGDFTSMSVDPSDDCTFWHTNEYYASDGAAWHTRIGAFKLPGCGANDFSISANPSSLSIAPGASDHTTISTAVTSGSAEDVSFSASGLPAGATVAFSPNPVTAGGSSTMTVTVDSNATPGTYTFTVYGHTLGATHTTSVSLTILATTPVVISPGSLPDGTVNTAYDQFISASGGTGPYSYAVTGGALPDGLTLDPSTGELYGAPTTTGAYSFTVTATDANGDTGTQDYTVNIHAQILLDPPGSLPDGTVNTAYDQFISASGGTGPYSYAVTGGALPDGLTLDPNSGELSGTPTTAGDASFTVTATDANGDTGTQDYTLTIGS